MKSRKSIGINAVVNATKTLVNIVFPLISYPYVSRILQAENLGRYNFSVSVVDYFYLLASLGISTYAIREGAKYRDNRKGISIFASEIFTINLISTIFSYAILLIIILASPKIYSYVDIISILSIKLLLTLVGCEWVYSIYEEYIYIAIRSILTHVIALVLMFLLVRSSKDTVWYATSVIAASSGANIINMVGLRKKVDLKIRLNRHLFDHLKPVIILFANTLATTIYVSSDITVLGILTTDYNVGIYSVSSKVYSIIKQVLGAIIMVSIPRLSLLWGEGKVDEFNRLSSKIINMISLLVIPAAVGIFSLRKEIILLISTSEFLRATSSLTILCLALVFCLFNWFYTSCILIPTKNEKYVLIATSISAIVNVLLNIVLIPIWGENAAALTTVIAEGISLVICVCRAKSVVSFRISMKELISVMVGCLFIAGYCYLIHYAIEGVFLVTIVCLLGSVLGYIVIQILLKNSTSLEIMSILKSKIGFEHS